MFFFKKKSGVTMDAPKRSHPVKEFVDDHGEFVEKALAIGAAVAVPVKMLFDIDALKKQGTTLTMQMGSVLAAMQRIEASTKRGPE